jgi:arylsulfatase A-like enzyme
VLDGLTESLEAELTATRLDNGKEHLFKYLLSPQPEQWKPMTVDLGFLAGERVRLSLSCDRVGKDAGPPDKLPLVCCGSPMVSAPPPAAPETPARNLIFISLDTLRADRLGCYGYARPVSPFLDSLAEKGFLFRRAYAHASYTLASHGSMFTSLYPSVHGLQNSLSVISPKATTLTEWLAEQGWATASFNGGGMVSYNFGFHRGFDAYCQVDPLGDRFTEGKSLNKLGFSDGSCASLNRALDWITTRKEERFFLFLHTFMVHDYMPPQELAERFDGDNPSGLQPGPDVLYLINRKHFGEHGITREHLDFFMNMYDATIRAADDMIRELFAHLEAQDLLENTLVIITSDHGEEFLEHGQVKHTQSVYEEVIHVPLIMAVPGMERGGTISACVSQIDLLPTLLELMHLPCPEGIQGRSLLPLMRGETEKDRFIYAEVDVAKQTLRSCVIQDGWKYIKASTDEDLWFPAPAEEELYFLTEDIREKENRLNAQPRKARQFKKLIDSLQTHLGMQREALSGGAESSQPLSPELQEMLRQQGYL